MWSTCSYYVCSNGFGAASTGTAISSLSGAAATNATLAWLGGGSLAAGGGGMAAGSVVLGTITATTTGVFALAAAGIVASAYYSKNTQKLLRIWKKLELHVQRQN